MANPFELDSHREVLEEALAIFQERDRKYVGLWREQGWTDSAHHIRSKGTRIGTLLSGTASLSDAANYLDDALDLINYCVFYIRNVREAQAGLASGPVEFRRGECTCPIEPRNAVNGHLPGCPAAR